MKNSPSKINSIYEKLKNSQEVHLNKIDKEDNRLEQIVKANLKNKNKNLEIRILNEIFDSGPLKELFDNPYITEILVNGEKEIYYEEFGEFHKYKDGFISKISFNNFIHKLCAETGTQFDQNTPHFDSFWKGFRIHLIAPPLVVSPHISFRRHPLQVWNFDKLKDQNWASIEAFKILRKQIKNKKNMIIIGPTGTGKTSALNACLQELSPLERAIIIEDSHELAIPNKMSAQLLTRSNDLSRLKEYNLSDLIRQSLRMRPDRLVLGEVRGPEAKDLLMLLSTGHKGGFCTLHADSARQALLRLEMLVQLGAPQWNLDSIRKLIHLSVDSLVVLKKEQGHRSLDSIHQISSLEEHGLLLERLY